MAIDVVGQLLCLSKVAQYYVIQDRDNLDEDTQITKEEIEQTIMHFKNQPIQLGARDLGTNLAGTNAHAVKPTIVLNTALLIQNINVTQFVRNFMLLVVTILHEVSHWNMRYNKVRITPEKFANSESGEDTELKLIGGSIFPSIPLDPQGKYLNYHLIWRSNGKDYIINDEWLVNICGKLITGDHIISDDIIPAGGDMYIPRAIARQTKPIKCTIHQERIDMGMDLLSLSTSFGPEKIKF